MCPLRLAAVRHQITDALPAIDELVSQIQQYLTGVLDGLHLAGNLPYVRTEHFRRAAAGLIVRVRLKAWWARRAERLATALAQAVASLLRADKNLDPDSAAAIDDILQAAMRLAEKRTKGCRVAAVVGRGFPAESHQGWPVDE